jgi:hypothetical protein
VLRSSDSSAVLIVSSSWRVIESIGRQETSPRGLTPPSGSRLHRPRRGDDPRTEMSSTLPWDLVSCSSPMALGGCLLRRCPDCWPGENGVQRSHRGAARREAHEFVAQRDGGRGSPLGDAPDAPRALGHRPECAAAVRRRRPRAPPARHRWRRDARPGWRRPRAPGTPPGEVGRHRGRRVTHERHAAGRVTRRAAAARRCRCAGSCPPPRRRAVRGSDRASGLKRHRISASFSVPARLSRAGPLAVAKQWTRWSRTGAIPIARCDPASRRRPRSGCRGRRSDGRPRARRGRDPTATGPSAGRAAA